MAFVENGPVRIRYEVVGHGPTLLLHTGAGGDSRMWRDAGYVKGLAEFRLMLMDQRGRGESGRPDRVEDHRIECFVSDVVRVLDGVGVDTVGFWGYSSGALVGIAFGADHPTRLKALVGTGGIPCLDLSDQPRIADETAEIQRLVALDGVVHELETFMNRTGERFPDAIDRNVRQTDPRMYALDEVAWLSWRGPKSAYPTFPAPVLALTGENEDSNRQTERSMEMVPHGQTIGSRASVTSELFSGAMWPSPMRPPFSDGRSESAE
jgi:pimeloyl-ACP methyl ester carboxylesterase